MDTTRFEELAALVIELRLVIADERQSVAIEQRDTVTDARERRSRALEVEHVRDTHGVEDARPGRQRRREIGITIDVREGDVGMLSHHSGQDSEGDRAVATEDERQDPPLPNLGDAIGHRPSHGDDPVHVLLLPVHRVGGEGHTWQVSQIGDGQTGSLEGADETGVTERPWCPAHACAIGAGS